MTYNVLSGTLSLYTTLPYPSVHRLQNIFVETCIHCSSCDCMC